MDLKFLKPADKASLFARNFSNSILDDSAHNLSDFPAWTNISNSSVRITPKFVGRAIFNLATSNSLILNGIHVIVLNMCSPELSSVLAKIFKL